MQRPHPVIVIVVALIPLAIVAGGASLLISAWPRVLEGLSARSWPEATGRVVDTQVVEVDQGGRGPGTKRWFDVRIGYAFDVDGRAYRGERNALYRELWQHPRAQDVAARFPSGHSVRVYYDPADPGRAVLDRGIGGGTWAMAIGGIPMLALGIVMMIGFVRAVRRSGSDPGFTGV